MKRERFQRKKAMSFQDLERSKIIFLSVAFLFLLTVCGGGAPPPSPPVKGGERQPAQNVTNFGPQLEACADGLGHQHWKSLELRAAERGKPLFDFADRPALTAVE